LRAPFSFLCSFSNELHAIPHSVCLVATGSSDTTVRLTAVPGPGTAAPHGHDSQGPGERHRGGAVLAAHSAVLAGHTARVTSALFLGDGTLVTGGGDSTVRTWRAANGAAVAPGAAVAKSEAYVFAPVRALACGTGPAGEFVACGCDDGSIAVLARADGSNPAGVLKVRFTVRAGKGGVAVNALAFGAGRVVAGCADGTVQVFEPKASEVRRKKKKKKNLLFKKIIRISPTHSPLKKKKIQPPRRTRANQFTLLRTIYGHSGAVRSVCVIPGVTLAEGGAVIAAGDEGLNVKLWTLGGGAVEDGSQIWARARNYAGFCAGVTAALAVVRDRESGALALVATARAFASREDLAEGDERPASGTRGVLRVWLIDPAAGRDTGDGDADGQRFATYAYTVNTLDTAEAFLAMAATPAGRIVAGGYGGVPHVYDASNKLGFGDPRSAICKFEEGHIDLVESEDESDDEEVSSDEDEG
jgi:hypothetical protein